MIDYRLCCGGFIVCVMLAAWVLWQEIKRAAPAPKDGSDWRKVE